MTLMMLAILMQQPTVEDRIAAFAKGDAAAREALLKVGAGAIPTLQKQREKAPEKIDDLILDIKVAASYPKLEKAPDLLKMKCQVDFQAQSAADAISFLQEFCGAPLVGDRAAAEALKGKVDLSENTTIGGALDHFCRSLGLDYGFFHGVVVISAPGRLWGTDKSRGVFGAPAVERQPRAPGDDKLLDRLREIKVSLDFQNVDMMAVAAYLKEITSFGFTVVDPDARKIPLFRLKDVSAIDAAALAAQMCDLDFMISDGRIVVGSRAEIDKKIAAQK